jgi:hypothetical protein
VRTNGHSVDDTAEVDVQSILVWLLQFTVCIFREAQVVGTWADTGIREDIVDSSMLVLCCFEELGKIAPVTNISLDEEKVALCRRVLDVTTDYQRTKRLQQLDGSESNARRATCDAVSWNVRSFYTLSAPVMMATLPLKPVKSSSLI